MRAVVSVLALVLAAVIVVVAALIALAVTSEYGLTPNRGGLGEAVRGVLSALPAALLVAVLVAVGARRAPARRRLLLALAGVLITLLAVALGMTLGHLSLQQRCDDLGPQHSAACRTGGLS